MSYYAATEGETIMSAAGGSTLAVKQVILYFDNEQDAYQFILAAASVIADPSSRNISEKGLHVAQPLARATRIRVNQTASHNDDAAALKAG